MKPLYLLAAAALFAAVSCERHSFEDTKALHETHDDHGDHATEGDHADHGHDDHSDHSH